MTPTYSRTRRTAAERSLTAGRLASGEDGFAVATVVMVSFLLLALMAVAMSTGERSQRSSARDRNSEVALSVAEAGVQHAMARIQSEALSSGTCPEGPQGSVTEGSYTVTITCAPGSFVIVSTGEVGGTQLGRKRTVRVTLGPPGTFMDALFSYTSIELKNNDRVLDGDIWANDSVLIELGGEVKGNVTAARSWIDIQGNTEVDGDVWSGGYNPSGPWAIRMAGGTTVTRNAKASVSTPADQATCGGESRGNYFVSVASNAAVKGNLTTWGTASNPPESYDPNVCTAAAVPRPMPGFLFNQWNYDQDYLVTFDSVAEFNTWFDSNGDDLQHTIVVHDPYPSQSNRMNLSGGRVVGDTTIVTNTPVFTNGIGDDNGPSRTFVVNSTYQPPPSTACSVNHDDSECAIHVKNNFRPSCVTAVLLYAPRGPVSVKNNQNLGQTGDAHLCGAVYADGILVKNNQTIRYDSRIASLVGFGHFAYSRDSWQERVSG